MVPGLALVLCHRLSLCSCLYLLGAEVVTLGSALMPSSALFSSGSGQQGRGGGGRGGKEGTYSATCSPSPTSLWVGHMLPCSSRASSRVTSPPSCPDCLKGIEFSVHPQACLNFCKWSPCKNSLLSMVCFLWTEVEQRGGGLCVCMCSACNPAQPLGAASVDLHSQGCPDVQHVAVQR